MACWKPFFANITSFFQRGSHHDVSEDQSRRSPADSGSVDSYDEASSSALPSSGFHVKRKHEGEKTVDELWEELLGHVRECHPTVLDNLYFTLRMKTQNEHDVTAVKNVFRREIIITLEQIYISCYIPRMKRRKTAGVQAAPTETLRCRPSKRKRLGKVENTDETSQLSTNGKRDVRYTVEEYEQKYQILEKRFQDSLEENEDLQLKVSSLTNCVKLFMAENERLNEAKGREEARAVHARRNAEMSHLLSKHSLSMAQLKDRQLKKAEGSSRAVMKRVEELQQVQNEIRTLLDNATRQSELHTQESRDGRTPSRSPRRFNRLRMALTRLSRNGNASLGGARVQAERPIEQSAALERDKPLMPMGNEQFFRKEARRKINVGEDEHELRRKTKRIRLEGSGDRKSFENCNDGGDIANRMQNLVRRARVDRTGDFQVAQDRESRRQKKCLPGSFWYRRLPWRCPNSQCLNQGRGSAEQNRDSAKHMLDALDKNLEAVRDMVGKKQIETDQLHEQLQAAVQQANEFEYRLRKEQRKRVESKLSHIVTGGGLSETITRPSDERSADGEALSMRGSSRTV